MLGSSFGYERSLAAGDSILYARNFDFGFHSYIRDNADIGIPFWSGILTPFFIKPKLRLAWRKDTFSVSSPEVVSATTHIAPHHLFDACAIFFDVENRALLGHGMNSTMFITLDGVEYPLHPVDARYLRSWGSTSVLGSDANYRQEPYLLRRIQASPIDKLSAKGRLSYLGFRAAEKHLMVRIDTDNIFFKEIGENIDITITFEAETEGGRKVAITQQYRVRFATWNNPTVEVIDDAD